MNRHQVDIAKACSKLKAGLVLAILAVAPLAVAAGPTYYLQDGNGYWWDFDADGSVVDGSSTAVEGPDSFDGAMRLRVDGALFPLSTSQMLDGRVLTTGPETVAGLVVTRRAYVPDTSGQGWACFLEYIENPGVVPVSAVVSVTGNLGSDGNTTVTGSSSGDAVFTTEDRWITSDDANDGAGDPSLSFNYWGVGAAVTPSAVFLPASQEDYYVEFPVTVPAESTVILMHFCAQNANNAAAAATATYLDGLPAAALAGLNASSGLVINWDVPPDDLSVTPSGAFAASGKHGGPFTPASRTFTLANSSTNPVTWTAAANETWLDVTAAGAVPAGGSETAEATLNALAEDLDPGLHTASITFTNAASGAHFVRLVQLTVTDRLTVAADDFLVAGMDKFVVRGRPGGPFVPTEAVYTLTNVDDQTTDWSVTTPAWLTATAVPALGTPLAPGASAKVTVTLEDTAANALTLGDYPDVLLFNNDTVGNAVSADVELRARDVVFVDVAAPAAGDGLAWGTAFNALQDGIDAAALTTPPCWVFVAGGEYVETITMEDGVEVFGGCAGTESNITDRDVANNPPTVINANAAGTAVTFAAIDNAGLDGLTVTGGAATDAGGVLFDGSAAGCYLVDVSVRENTALHRGGGVYCVNKATPSLLACSLIGNAMGVDARDFGGGIACYLAAPKLYDCLIAANDGRYGGGVGCIESSPTLTNCRICANTATIAGGGAGGGGVFAHNKSHPIFTNCLISGNYAHDWNAGTLYCQGEAKPVLTNCTLSSNSSNAGRSGGIVVNTGSMPTLVNCTLDGLSGTAIIEESPSSGLALNEADVIVSHCLFANNAIGDFADWTGGVATTYTGGDQIDAHVDGALDNVAGGPDPQYLGGITGAWTVAPVYDPLTNLTTLTTTGAPFTTTPPALEGQLINADTSQSRQALIISNTANTVSVLGDITSATGNHGYADLADTFALLDYHLNGDSPCVNVGDDSAPYVRDSDIEGQVRVDEVDLGAYEASTPSGASVLSISPVGGSVANGATVEFEVLFSRALDDGLTVDDFVLNFEGLSKTTPTITSLTGGGYLWIVTVNTGDQNGRVGLDLVDSGTAITDQLGLALAGNYTEGDEVVIDFLEITGQPLGALGKHPGDMHSFSVLAEHGIGTLHYQWRCDGVPVGTDSSVLTILALALEDSGTYTCDVTDDQTTVTSENAVLEVVVKTPVASGLGLALLAAACAAGGARSVSTRRRRRR